MSTPRQPAGVSGRYPTASDTVRAALADGVPDAAPDHPVAGSRYRFPCNDLDGGDHELFVVPLGRRLAVVVPGGATAVLTEPAVIDLAGILEEAFMVPVHGGVTSMGTVPVTGATSMFEFGTGSLSVEAHAYGTTATLLLSCMQGCVEISVDPVAVRQLKEMLAQTERVLAGEIPDNPPREEQAS